MQLTRLPLELPRNSAARLNKSNHQDQIKVGWPRLLADNRCDRMAGPASTACGQDPRRVRRATTRPIGVCLCGIGPLRSNFAARCHAPSDRMSAPPGRPRRFRSLPAAQTHAKDAGGSVMLARRTVFPPYGTPWPDLENLSPQFSRRPFAFRLMLENNCQLSPHNGMVRENQSPRNANAGPADLGIMADILSDESRHRAAKVDRIMANPGVDGEV